LEFLDPVLIAFSEFSFVARASLSPPRSSIAPQSNVATSF
jgi:hypothetical protein